MSGTKSQRIYGYDNIKCILMFLVVFGHLLEFCTVPCGTGVYRLIYFFHMPFFIFLSGYFAKEKPAPSDILKQAAIYFVFQTIYISASKNTFTYATPYWILWYSLTTLFYSILTPLYDLNTPKKQITAVAVAFIISLLAGYDNSIGYFLSLSRFFVFQPFFLMGFYFKKNEHGIRRYFAEKPKSAAVLRVTVILLAVLTVIYAFNSGIDPKTLYGAYPYSELQYNPFVRAVSQAAAIIWIILFLFVLMPVLNRRLPLVSTVGANTLPVYLFHGLIMRLLKHFHPQFMDSYITIIIVSAVCLVMFGNRYVSSIFRINPKLK